MNNENLFVALVFYSFKRFELFGQAVAQTLHSEAFLQFEDPRLHGFQLFLLL